MNGSGHILESTNQPFKQQGAMGMTLEKVKVYELAKELGLDSFALLEKIKQLNIDVKNHMSSLEEDAVATIKASFSKGSSGSAAKTGAKTVKRKSTTTAASAAAAAAAAAEAKKSSTVIRRRSSKTEGGETTVVETTITHGPDGKSAITSQPGGATEAEMQAAAEQMAAAEIEGMNAAPVFEKVTEDSESESPSPVEPAPLLTSGLKMPSLLAARAAARTSGVPLQKQSSILTIIKQEPRKPLPPKSVAVKPGTTTTIVKPVTAGIINLGKEAIDRMVEEEQNFKKKSGPGGRSEKEKEPFDVKVSDYRAKKELIFLPKKKKIPINKEVRATKITTPAAHKRVIKIDTSITVAELAQRLGIKSNEIMKKLIGMGMMVTLHQNLDLDTATLLATEYGYEVENVAFKEEVALSSSEDKAEDLQPRPPIVTVMGHVDHGKTSLLDAIRSAKVAEGEAGGITQHIGAYTVQLDGKPITFIDTPGHEAFTVMRARGANVTDIVILVVAADDGVMPQTREAVAHAKAANVPIIVAVNKMDKPGANPERVMKQLSELGLLSEAWGGENIFAHVSAIKHTGIKELLESILLQAEVLDLKANPNRPAEGTVLEAKLERGRGAVVDILVKKGSLKIGDVVVAGAYCGRVRALVSDRGENLKSIGPAYAAELLGLEGVPTAGDTFNVMPSEAEAREVAEHRISKIRAMASGAKSSKMTLEELFGKIQQGESKELPVVLKTDVFGSAEAIKESLNKLATEKVKVKVLHASTGGITESDVMLASASNAIILGFNVRPETKALVVAESEKVEVKTYSIIYELIDEVKKAMTGLLEKKAVERYLGRAEVRQSFSVPKIGTIAGCGVVDGKIQRSAQVRLLRDSRVIFTGKISSLKRFKDDAKEVAQGYECGIGIENFNDIKVGDVIEAFTVDMITQELDAPLASKDSNNEATR